jgi:eukaryotic-like serine/threonine-protein kinase
LERTPRPGNLAAVPTEQGANDQQIPNSTHRDASPFQGSGLMNQLGPYELLGVLGRGGMGTVYRARHQETGDTVAVKALAQNLTDDEHFRTRFTAEIQALLKLDHPNIVRLLGYGENDGALYFAMELVEGKSLFHLQREIRTFDWRDVLVICRDVASGLRHAHDRGIIHRDLKPGNLIKSADGVIKITDFGIAKEFGVSHDTRDNVVGTIDYMSPEQALGRPVTARSDLYSLGVVLYSIRSNSRSAT